LIDFLIYNYFIFHTDFWNRNYYLIRNTNPSKFYLIPWDFDGSFGQWGVDKYDAYWDIEDTIRIKNGLYDRLMGNEEFMKSCKNRWFELRKELWTEDFILDMLIENYEKIKDTLKFSTKLWDQKINIVEQYIDFLFKWIPERLDFCDSYFSQF
jgi:spore coat protein CotH